MKNKRKLFSGIMVVAIIAGMLPMSYIAFAKITDKENIESQSIIIDQEDTLKSVPQESIEVSKEPKGGLKNAISTNSSINVKRTPNKEIDVTNIQISKEIQDQIRNKDVANGDKYINNYKKLLVEFNVPESYKEHLEKLMRKKHDIVDIFTAYEFLNENYGEIGELEDLLDKKEKGDTWSEVFREYFNQNSEFVPRNFEPGYLENILKYGAINVDDIMIADRVSIKERIDIEILIQKRKSGETWKKINSEIGIINTSDKLPRVGITSDQVKKLMDKSGLTEKEVVDSLIMAEKLDQDDDEIIFKVKQGKKKEDIYSETYEKKYR